MKAEQGPLWGCDPECGLGADTKTFVLAGWFGGAAA
jgi:hypothetical protein